MIKHLHHRLQTFIIEQSFTSIGVQIKLLQHKSISGSNVVLERHTRLVRLHASFDDQPNKRISEDTRDDIAPYLLIIHSRMVTVGTVPTVHAVICNKRK